MDPIPYNNEQIPAQLRASVQCEDLLKTIRAQIRAAYVRGVHEAAAQIETRLTRLTPVESGLDERSTAMTFTNLETLFSKGFGHRSAQGITLYMDAFFPVRAALATVRAAKEELLTPDETMSTLLTIVSGLMLVLALKRRCFIFFVLSWVTLCFAYAL